MKQLADTKRKEKHFNVGDLVLLKMIPYRQTTVATRLHPKLGRRFFGPYPVTAKVGEVAYTLQLPPSSQIHPTFHVSQLKSFHGAAPDTSDQLPVHFFNSKPIAFPAAILAMRIVTIKDQQVKQILVQWSHSYPDDATWENFHEMCSLYLNYTLRTR
ncbi:uncharacterized protein [Henckelia pumila]|uniref:uncharacterized protein n=1 Tax=Henckelia pumila TaxID=405737 RepID=UPI003C6E30FB